MDAPRTARRLESDIWNNEVRFRIYETAFQFILTYLENKLAGKILMKENSRVTKRKLNQ